MSKTPSVPGGVHGACRPNAPASYFFPEERLPELTGM